VGYKRRKHNIIQSSHLKIHIACEGPSEESILKDVLKDYKYITVKSIDGGGYGKFTNYVERNKDLYPIFFIVADLDKAQNDESARRLLNEMIKKVNILSNMNTIFLTGPEIEYWVACCIGRPNLTSDDLSAMDYKKGNKVADFISKNHGSYWLGCQLITNNRLYYNKMSHKDKYSIAPENLQNKQSNLVNLLPYIQKMQQDKLN